MAADEKDLLSVQYLSSVVKLRSPQSAIVTFPNPGG
jgi:hypothetical protein